MSCMNPLTLHHYNEIDNLSQSFIKSVRAHGFDKSCAEWVCTDKMDGAQFQVSIDANNEPHFASRNMELDRYTNFNSYQHIIQRDGIVEKVKKAKQLWLESQHGTKDGLVLVGQNVYPVTFCMYFELLGGVYRHADVEPVKGAVKLQGRVQYCPDNRIVCFDIFVYIHLPNGEGGFYLSPDDVAFYCAQVGLYSQLIVFRGTFDEAIAYPNDYKDEIGHLMFGLPELEENVVEGNVIKPVRELRFSNGARVIVKNKNKIFLERGRKTNRVKHPTEPMNELEEQWYNTMSEFATESRLHSVLSKMDVSSITQKDFGTILRAYMEDLNKDFNKEYGGQIQVLEGQYPVGEFNMHKVYKGINKDVSDMIRPVFIDLMQKCKHEETT